MAADQDDENLITEAEATTDGGRSYRAQEVCLGGSIPKEDEPSPLAQALHSLLEKLSLR